MSGAKGEDGFSADKAELFEALGHQTRMKILRLLADSPRSFSELKNALDIESSGQLQFHLGKMKGLVRTNDEGDYALTDDGKEALRITTVEPAMTEERLRRLRKRLRVFSMVVLALAVACIATHCAYIHGYSEYAAAAKSIQVSGFTITNFTIVEWNSPDGQMVFVCEVEYIVRNPSDYAFELHFHQIYQSLEIRQLGWSLCLVQPTPCAIPPNSTTVLRAVTGYYSPLSGNIYAGSNSLPHDNGLYVCSYLSNITGIYCDAHSMGQCMSGEAMLSNGIFNVKLLHNQHGWEDA